MPTSKPNPNPNPTPGPGPAPGPGPGPAPTPGPGPAPTPTPVPGKSQTFNIQDYFFGIFDPDRIRQIFTKSGTIESFTSNLSISTNTETYNVGTKIGFFIIRREVKPTKLIPAGEVNFPPNPYLSINTQIALGEYISVQQGDELFIGGFDTIGQVSGTITVNFI